MLNFSVTFFITIFNIAFLVFILWKLLFKPVTQFMDKRTQKIEGDLANASLMQSQAEELSRRYAKLLGDADKEVKRILEEGEVKAHDEAKVILTQARADAVESRKRGEESAQREFEHAKQALVDDIAKMATRVAATIIGKNVKDADQHAVNELVRMMESEVAR